MSEATILTASFFMHDRDFASLRDQGTETSGPI